MGRLIYAINTSLDGYISDMAGKFDWSKPEEDVNTYINQFESANKISILGRGMYEALSVWETMEDTERFPEYIRAYKDIWLGKKKIVFSHSLSNPATANTEVRNRLTASEIEDIKRASSTNITIGGANLASQFMDLGLVDEVMLFVHPIIIGNGKKWIENSLPARMEHHNTVKFGNGIVLLHYFVL